MIYWFMRVVSIAMILLLAKSPSLFAACGANTRTWQADAASTAWNNNNNWNPRNRPNQASENALIISDWFNPTYPANNYTLGCLEIQSGLMTAAANRRLTIVGDYFRNLNANSLIIPGGSTWEVRMQGTAAQTFENVDSLPRLRINNATTVTLTESFEVSNRFLIDAGTGNVIIEKHLTTLQTNNISIPAGVTVTLEDGASWSLSGNLQIDGTLVMEPGSSLDIANGRTLTINATGTLDVNGVTGNAVSIDAENASSTFTFVANGTLDAQYLTIDHMTTNGVQMNATVNRFDNVNISSILSGGRAITIGAAASLPSSMDEVGFFTDGGAGSFTNVHASAYSGSALEFTNWSGIGDTANEVDGNNVINWGTEATPVLQVHNVSPAGVPPATIAKGSAATHFATYAFSMSGTAATATDVTQVIFTLDGTNFNSDVSSIDVYNDTVGNCTYDAGTDLLIGSYAPAGTPGTITVNMSSSEINVIDTTQDCLHVFVSTASTSTTGSTVGISIEATDDITNSQAYELSGTSGPPLSAGTAEITGAAVRRWNGGYGTNMFTAANWTPSGVPNSTIDCEVGNGYSNPQMSATFNCQNTLFQNSGTVNWANTTNIFRIYGAFTVESGFTYQNAGNARIELLSTGDQSVTLNGTTYPNDMTINSGGTVTFEDSGTISGNLTLSGGTIKISGSSSLTVSGNITVASGVTFDIEPGGELILGNGSSITVNSGGTLELVGTGAQSTNIRAVNDTSSYTVTINNGATISANHYSFRNLGLNGLTVNATATIDGTNSLQNGTFIYPGVNNANLLRLFREIPGDVLDGMSFDSDSSGATGGISVYTNVGGSVDTLSITNYSGDMTGASFTDDNTYLVSWGAATNELKITQESTAPASANQGDIVDMGTFGFQQLDAGAFNDTDITSLRVTLTGTGSASDINSVSLYYDSACSGSGGTLIGSMAFTGSPARAIFSSITGATVEAHATTPPLRCFNVVYNIDSLATDGKTVGAEITSSTHVTNSEGYSFNASFAPPVNLGTTSIVGVTTQWTGATSTDWYNAANWSSGVPNSSLNCIINDEANDPLINAGTATCKSINIGNGNLTLSGGSLELYGSLESTGTITASAPIVMRDDGVTPTSQVIDISSSLSTLQFNKTAGGTIDINSDVSVTNAISISGAQDFTLNITNNNSLIANAGLTLSGATIDMDGGSELQIGAGQTFTINGGTFRTSGTNDPYPQTLSNKAHITNTGGTGTWTFSASSGTVDLTGFYIDWLDTSGLNFSGTVTLSNLNGGQLRNLPSVASVRALQFNTTGSIPSTASNFGWNWGPDNTPLAEATAYFLGFSSGCGSQTIDFDQWFGDFWPYTTAVTTDKISSVNCTILIDRAKSPVSLTELKATPYDGKVVIEWTTGNEWDHRGFNVYRSLNPNDSFVQVNTDLIRNDLFSTNIHGTYAFIDEGVSNGTTYYYMLEDLSLMGESTLHGPLQALPDGSLGLPPSPQAGTIVSNGDETGTGQGDSSGGDVKEISENVWMLSQTSGYMRMKIVVPALTMSPDPLNTSYQKLAIDGYTLSTDVGLPELPTKTVLVKLDQLPHQATWQFINENQTDINSVVVTPAPEYVSSGNSMIAQWTIDNSFYGTNTKLPKNRIELGSPVTLNGESFLPIIIHPVAYNPVTQNIDKLDELIFDIYLEGSAPWSVIDSSKNPWTREGGIKVGLLEEGLFRVTYDQLNAAGVVGPLDGADINHIHLHLANVQMGLDIESANGIFDSGDEIRFYAPSLKSDEDKRTFALLYVDSGQSSNLKTNVNAAVITEPDSDKSSFWTKKVYEENNIAVFNEPFTEETDHFMWSLIYGISGGAKSPLEFDIDLESLDSQGDVVVRVAVKSRRANSINTHHNLELYVNADESVISEESFEAMESKLISFRVPANHFVSGKNKIKLVASGDNLSAGEYDMLYVDKVDIFYSQGWLVENDEALVLDQPQGYAYQVEGFNGTDILVYDVSNPRELYQFDSVVTGAGSVGSYARFALNGNSQGRRLWVGRATQFKTPTSYQLIEASDLTSSQNQADILFIGHKDLLAVARDLGDLRETQGYQVQYVPLESIYNEFGHGLANVQSVKDFIIAARSWQKSPEYIILLGDGTYDPKAYQNASLKYRFPVKFIKGSSFDYVSDHWFVDNEQGLPEEVVARIPARSPSDLQVYIDKVLAYESGERKPEVLANISFFSDKPAYSGENFVQPIEDIKALGSVSSLENQMPHKSRVEMSDTDFKQEIDISFSQSSVVHYMGHGAENMWADSSVFNNNDVKALSNNKLPIVLAMNCLNGSFADVDIESFAEELIFNPQGGAILFWGSTSLTPPSIQKIYQESFYQNMADGEYKNIGDLVKMSKIQAGLSSPFNEILYSWSVIGDPLVQPSIQHKAQAESPEPSSEEVVPSSGGGGCSAVASQGRNKSHGQWNLFLGFLLEVFFMLSLIRMVFIRHKK